MEKISHCIPIILAAGKGTRMHTSKPKVLHTILGEPMLEYVLHSVQEVFSIPPLIIVGYNASDIEKNFSNYTFVRQQILNGTGGALNQALPFLNSFKNTLENPYLFIINGDTPLITSEIIQDFINDAIGSDVAFASVQIENPGAYGRVVFENGILKGIIEAKDYDENIYGKPLGLINAGMYYIKLESAVELLPKITNNNAAAELYLTDLIGLGIASGLKVKCVICKDSMRLLGVNSPAELIEAEEYLARQTIKKFLEDGVIIHRPEMASINPHVEIAKGVEIFAPCEIFGHTIIKKDVIIESNCYIKDSFLDDGAHLKSFSHLDGAKLCKNAVGGPYVRLRPGAILEEGAHAGNFVELKKAVLGKGSKANHLTYLGDSEIGSDVNIGAGTITCNYDGKNKYMTKIGSGSFIGSNTSLVAPVNIGENSLIGAGSVITHDVNDNELGITRAKQKNLPRRKK